MRLMFFSPVILNSKIYGNTYGKQRNSNYQNIEAFHFYSSLSFGITKYAVIVNSANKRNTPKLKGTENFPDTKLPIIPAVKTYLAASANILATTFLLSLFILQVYHKKEATMNLSMLKPGENGKITKIGAIGSLKRRLMDMGILVGEVVKVEKIAPLGDPIEVTIKNYNLSLRKKEAEGIEVKVIK